MVRPGAAAGKTKSKKNHHGDNSNDKGAAGKQHAGAMRATDKDAAFKMKAQSMMQEGNWTNVQSMDDLQANMALDPEFMKLVDKYSHEVFHDAESLPAVVLMNDGRFEDLCYADVQELFVCLDTDESGSLEFDEVELLLKEVLDPPCSDAQIEAIYEHTDKNKDRVISSDEFYKALMGPVRDTLKKMQKENILKKEFEMSFGLDIEIDRGLMIDRLKGSVARDDSFRTLPFSLAYICIFIFLVIVHLNIWDRQQLERGTEAWIDGYGQQLLGPYLGSVGSIDGMFDWFVKSGLPAVFGDCQTTGDPVCLIGPRSALVGDVALRQSRRDGTEKSVWLLHSDEAVAHLKLKPEDYLVAATAATKHVYNSGWADEGTMDVRLVFATFGMRSEMYTITTVICKFDDYGMAFPSTSSFAVVVKPYPSAIGWKITYFAFDIIYVFFLLIPLYGEIKDLLRAMHSTGIWDGFVSYFDPWNVVDWVTMITSFVSMQIWVQCVGAMSMDTIQSILKEDGDRLVLAPGSLSIPTGTLDILHEDMLKIIVLFNALRLVMAATSCTILMKFFKAFQANPRLQVVTDTMVKAASDIVHFSIVFLAVFIGFAVTGHIFFGNDLKQFRSMATSVDTCFICLMGDFGWYAEESESDAGLASGMPYVLLGAWFWLYMVFVLMILLNMLLAIILDHYTEIVTQIKMDIDVPALWTQTNRYLHAKKHTKDHIPLIHLQHLLEDDDTPCHTSGTVNEHTLMEAFPKMQREQADHLVKWLRNEAKKEAHDADDEMMARIKMVEHHIETVCSDLHVVKLNSAVCTSLLRGQAATNQAARADGLSSCFATGVGEQVAEQVDRLVLKIMGGARQLAGRMEAVSKEMENQSSAIEEGVTGISQEATMPAMGIRGMTCMASENCYGPDRSCLQVEAQSTPPNPNPNPNEVREFIPNPNQV